MLYSENLKIGKTGIVFTDKHGRKLSSTAAINKILNRIVSWLQDFNLYIVHAVSTHIPFYSLRSLVFRMVGVKIGRGSTIHMGCKFFNPAGVEIGIDSKIGSDAFLDGRSRLVIGDHVDIASEVMIYNSEHDINDPDFKAINGEVEIGDYVFIGPRAIILPGVKIGSGAIIAAGAVVTKNVESLDMIGGVPGKVIGQRKNKDFKYVLGRARLFQ